MQSTTPLVIGSKVSAAFLSPVLGKTQRSATRQSRAFERHLVRYFRNLRRLPTTPSPRGLSNRPAGQCDPRTLFGVGYNDDCPGSRVEDGVSWNFSLGCSYRAPLNPELQSSNGCSWRCVESRSRCYRMRLFPFVLVSYCLDSLPKFQMTAWECSQ